jgi:hypothetical protein
MGIIYRYSLENVKLVLDLTYYISSIITALLIERSYSPTGTRVHAECNYKIGIDSKLEGGKGFPYICPGFDVDSAY